MKILITGFDAFGGESRNPALEAVRLVTPPEGVELVKLEIPTVFGLSADLTEAALLREQPEAVLCIGQAGGRSAVTVERIAINIMDASISDNRGFSPKDQPVQEGGPAAYFATVPVKKLVSAIREAGVPAAVSNSAGTFVCNALLYRVLSFCEENCPRTEAGFLHVPFLPEQAENHPGCPSLSLMQMVTALEAAIQALCE